ncbi:MAG: amidophosphoribosyltransferase, partial [Flavobacteriaceae bacterium]|nr:amidophosphoribosyltransferase [Flavobacteriaceae bacterium]
MSDAIKHECGIALVRLLKPIQYYKDKYGSAFYGINKMYLLMEKQHNRGQDGAGFASLKFDVKPGTRYISRVRSNEQQPIQDVFAKINKRLNRVLQENPDKINDIQWQIQNMPYIGNIFLGHVSKGTIG